MEAVWMCVSAVTTGWAVLATVRWWCAELDLRAARASAAKYEAKWLDAIQPEQTADRAG